MSIGIGARANIISQDSKTVIYEYGGYNLNKEQLRNEKHIYDGRIIIQRRCFQKLEMCEKLKEMPNGNKKLANKKIVEVDYLIKCLKEDLIVIDNCTNCWAVTNGEKQVDMMALSILSKIFQIYQEHDKIPQYISYDV